MLFFCQNQKKKIVPEVYAIGISYDLEPYALPCPSLEAYLQLKLIFIWPGSSFDFLTWCLEANNAETYIIYWHNMQGTEHAARRAAAFVRGDDVVHKLFTELAYRYR
jgi:hypothetical protein